MSGMHRPGKGGARLTDFGFGTLIVCTILALFLSPLMTFGDGPTKALDDGRIVVLEPETWVGKQFPLLEEVDIGGDLAKGNWTVVLYYHDCPYCIKAVPKYEKMARERAGGADVQRLAFVEIPPYNPTGLGLVTKSPIWTQGKLSETKDWFAATPVVVELVDGKVKTAQERATLDKSEKEPAPGAAMGQPVGPVEVAAIEGEYDFGYVEPGSGHRVLFAVRSPVNRALTVQKTRSECPCMGVSKPPGMLEVAEPTPVMVDFVAPKVKMMYSRRVALMTTDPECPAVFLRVKASVGLPLEVTPRVLDLGTVLSGQLATGEVTIRNCGKTAVRPAYATTSDPSCVVCVSGEAIPAGGALTFPVRMNGSDLTPGNHKVSVSIRTDSPAQSQVELVVRYTAVAEFRISSDAFDVKTLTPGEKKTLALQIVSVNGDKRGLVEGCGTEGLVNAIAEANATENGPVATITCDVVAGRETGAIEGQVLVTLSGYPGPVRIPVTGQVAAKP